MKPLRMMLLALAAGAIQAQDMTEVTVQPDFVSGWFDNATAIEIDIPTGAHTYAVQFGPDVLQPAMSTFLKNRLHCRHRGFQLNRTGYDW